MLFQNIIKTAPIQKGWSCDQKYRVTTSAGETYLLRITPFDKKEAGKTLFEILQQVAALGISMCRPVESGDCSEGFYTLYTWIDGKDAEDVIPLMSRAEQYALGLQAGEILKQIHTIPAPATLESWHTRFGRKTDYKIRTYQECGVRFTGDNRVIDYLRDNRALLNSRPQTFQHGDYHIGNMMMKNGKLVIIDFDRYDFGDPWEEFNRIVWSAQASPSFAAGTVDGYFDKAPPMEFWKCTAFYIGSNTLSSIYWGAGFGQSDLAVMLQQARDVLSWYDDFHTVIPRWYRDVI